MRGWTFSFLFLISLSGYSQKSKEALEQRKLQLQEDINIANILLKKTQKDKVLTLNEVRTLDRKVNARAELIKTVQFQIKNTERQISQMQKEILRNEKEINIL